MMYDELFNCFLHGAKRHQWCRDCERVTANRRAYQREVSPLVIGDYDPLHFGRIETSDNEV